MSYRFLTACSLATLSLSLSACIQDTDDSSEPEPLAIGAVPAGDIPDEEPAPQDEVPDEEPAPQDEPPAEEPEVILPPEPPAPEPIAVLATPADLAPIPVSDVRPITERLQFHGSGDIRLIAGEGRPSARGNVGSLPIAAFGDAQRSFPPCLSHLQFGVTGLRTDDERVVTVHDESRGRYRITPHATGSAQVTIDAVLVSKAQGPWEGVSEEDQWLCDIYLQDTGVTMTLTYTVHVHEPAGTTLTDAPGCRGGGSSSPIRVQEGRSHRERYALIDGDRRVIDAPLNWQGSEPFTLELQQWEGDTLPTTPHVESRDQAIIITAPEGSAGTWSLTSMWGGSRAIEIEPAP